MITPIQLFQIHDDSVSFILCVFLCVEPIGYQVQFR